MDCRGDCPGVRGSPGVGEIKCSRNSLWMGTQRQIPMLTGLKVFQTHGMANRNKSNISQPTGEDSFVSGQFLVSSFGSPNYTS